MKIAGISRADANRFGARTRGQRCRSTSAFAPAIGERIVARGRVVKAGRTLRVTQTDVFALNGGMEKLVALLTATMMSMAERADIGD